jgi:hypothetical protein
MFRLTAEEWEKHATQAAQVIEDQTKTCWMKRPTRRTGKNESGLDSNDIGSLGGGADDECRIAGETAQRVLVEDAGHGLIEFGQLVAEMDRTFEEHLDGDGPELVVVGCGVITQEIFDAALLHGGENGTRYLGEIGKFLFEVFVLLGLGDEVDISQGMRHFMKANVAVGGIAGDPAHEIIPGQINAGLIHMPHEWTGIEAVVVVIAEDKDIVEVIELEFFQPESQLHCGGAHQDGHLSRLFHLYIMKVLGMLELKRPEQELALVFQTQAIIIAEMAGNNRMIESLAGNKAFELVSCIKALG